MSSVSTASPASVASSSQCTSCNEWQSIFDEADLDNAACFLHLDSSLFDFNECAM